MATARIIHRWDDGAELLCEIKVADTFPDVVAEAKAQALSMFRGALEVTSEADEKAGGA